MCGAVQAANLRLVWWVSSGTESRILLLTGFLKHSTSDRACKHTYSGVFSIDGAQTRHVPPFSTELCFHFLTQLHRQPDTARTSRDAPYAAVMPVTNNGGGMCCEEIEEFVVGRGSLDVQQGTGCSTRLCADVCSAHACASSAAPACVHVRHPWRVCTPAASPPHHTVPLSPAQLYLTGGANLHS